jgi:hypothetical protein
MSYASVVLADTPLGFWKFNEPSGTSAADSSGNGYNGTYTGGFTLGHASIIPTTTDTAVSLNGTTGYIAVSGFPQIASPFSFEAVFNAASLSGSRTVIGRDTDAWTSGNGAFYFKMSSDDSKMKFSVQTGVGSEVSVISPTTFSTGTGYHMVGVYNGSNLHIYINGIDKGSTNTSVAVPHQVGDLVIGASYYNDTLFDYCQTTLQGVAIYNYALTAAQVLTHYNATQWSVLYSRTTLSPIMLPVHPVVFE